MSCIIYVLRKAFVISKSLDRFNTSRVSAEIIVAVDDLIKQQKNLNVIDVESVQAAIRLLDYFNQHKLNFAGFKIGKTLVDTIAMFPNSKAKVNKVREFSGSDEICRRILLFPGNIVAPMFLNKLRKINKLDCLESFSVLTRLELGNCHEYKPKSGAAYSVFVKTKINADSIKHVSALAKYGLSTNDYLCSFDASLRNHREYTGSKAALGILH